MVAHAGGRGVGTNQEAVRRHNLSTLLGHLHRDGPLSRAELTARMQLNRSTIAALAGELESWGAVRQTAPRGARRSAGRPSVTVRPGTDRVYTVAVDVRVDAVTVAAVGLGGQVLRTVRQDIPPRQPPEEFARTVAALAGQARAAVDPAAVLAGVGVAVPGSVSEQDGVVRSAPNLGWVDVPLAALLGRSLATDRQPHVGNDADLGALAEHTRGSGAGIDDLVFLLGDVGVGGGVVVGGVPLRGSGGLAGEMGHLTVTPDGRPCRCGNRGCWETEVGATAVARALGDGTPVEELPALLRAVDRPPAALVRVGERLGTGLAGVVNVFNPRRVILGGLLAELYPTVREACDGAFRVAALDAPAEQVEITVPALGHDAVLVGAAERAFADLLDDPAEVLSATRPAAAASAD